MSAAAEGALTLSSDALAALVTADTLTTARIAGILAAKRVAELIPLNPAGSSAAVTMHFAVDGSVIRIQASGEIAIAAMTAVSIAALTLYDMAGDAGAVIEAVRLTSASSQKKSQNQAAYRSVGAPDITMRGERARPQVLMGEVASPRAGPDTRREAFRNFMTTKRLRPTTWAKDAGVTTGEIMGFLTGRSRGFSGEVAEKLARAAKVNVEDMFR